MPKEPQGHIWPLLLMASVAGALASLCFYQYAFVTPGSVSSSDLVGSAVSFGLLAVWLWRRHAQGTA